MRGHKTVYIATMLVSLAVVIGGGFMLIRHFLTTDQPHPRTNGTSHRRTPVSTHGATPETLPAGEGNGEASEPKEGQENVWSGQEGQGVSTTEDDPAAVQTPETPKDTASVSGKVSDTYGRPVASAAVELYVNVRLKDEPVYYHLWQRTTTTNSKGEYSFDGIPAGGAYIRVDHEDFIRACSRDLDVAEGARIIGVDFTLEGGGSVSGRVSDEQGRLLKDVQVTVWGRCDGVADSFYRQKSATTDETGTYRIRGVKAGQQYLLAKAVGYIPGEAHNVEVVDGVETAGIDFVLSRGTTISGRVYDAVGSPLQNVSVYAEHEAWFRTPSPFRLAREVDDVYTDESGGYKLEGLTAEPYTIRVSARGYASARRTGVVGGSTGVDFVLTKSGQITGRVVNYAGCVTSLTIHTYRLRTEASDPLPWRWKKSSGGAGKNGVFEVSVDEPGTYAIDVAVKGYGVGRAENIVVRSGEVSEVVEIFLARGATISGRVLCGHDRTPIADAEVNAKPKGVEEYQGYISSNSCHGYLTTRADGSFVFEDVRSGNYVISANYKDLEASTVVTVPDGPLTVSVELLLHPQR